MTRALLTSALLATFLWAPSAVAQTPNWATRDLGAATPALYVADLDMPSQNVIWGILWDGSGNGTVVQDVLLSADGGVTWQTNSIITAHSADKTLTNVSAIDASTAYVGGFDENNGGGYLFRTTNGGNTFTELTIPTMTYLNFVHFFDATTGIIAGDPTGTGNYWEVFRTTDGAATWSRVPQASIPPADPPSAQQPQDYGFNNLFTAAGDHVWFASLRGSVYHSTNRGLTWTKTASGFTRGGTVTSPTPAVTQIAFSDALHGLMVGRTGMRSTANGGTTWAPVTPVGTVFNESLTAVPGLANAYVGANNTLLAGIGASVTLDGGQTWTTLDSAQRQFTHVIFFDNRHGWGGSFTEPGGIGGMLEYVGVPLATPHELVSAAPAVYPNPTAGRIQLQGADPRETILVYDMAGRLLRRHPLAAGTTLDLSDLPTGLYQLVFTGGRSTPHTTRIALSR